MCQGRLSKTIKKLVLYDNYAWLYYGNWNQGGGRERGESQREISIYQGQSSTVILPKLLMFSEITQVKLYVWKCKVIVSSRELVNDFKTFPSCLTLSYFSGKFGRDPFKVQ